VYTLKNEYNFPSALDRGTEIDRLSQANSLLRRVSLELIHEQLPLPVPCYDLLPVIEFTVVPDKLRFRVLPTPLS
jgi:hypothetical protein